MPNTSWDEDWRGQIVGGVVIALMWLVTAASTAVTFFFICYLPYKLLTGCHQ